MGAWAVAADDISVGQHTGRYGNACMGAGSEFCMGSKRLRVSGGCGHMPNAALSSHQWQPNAALSMKSQCRIQSWLYNFINVTQHANLILIDFDDIVYTAFSAI